MKIQTATAWKEHFSLTKPYTIAYETFDHVENIFVRVDTHHGTFGIGVASPAPDVTGESAADCQNALDQYLEPLLQGRDVRHLKTLVRELGDNMASTPAAMAAADMALHDLLAKVMGIPLVDLLGRCHESLATSVTVGINSIRETLEEAAAYLGQGFKILKIKIGSDLEEDVERLFKLREQIGQHVPIRVDVNQGYTRETFAAFVQKTALLDLEFTEQPLKHDDIEAMSDFSTPVRKKVAADESLHGVADAFKLAASPHPFGIFNIKLMKCGGIAPGVQIADIAHMAGIDVMWGCMDESVVGISAALHAALACPATRYLDLDGHLDLARDIAAGGFRIHEGRLYVLDKPGLGITLQ
jgi:L-alanine-DL-glutamate epimerase-like enolase superfamily enzyme